MKRICFISTTSVTLKTFVLPTAKYLHDNGSYDITFICSSDPDFYKDLPGYIRYIPVNMKRGIDPGAWRTVIKLTQLFKAEKFDMVQYCTPNASFYASIASKFARIPVRLYCQWGIRYAGIEGAGRNIFKFFEKISCKNATEVRAVSKKNMEFAVKEGLYKSDKAYLLGSGGTIGVDFDDFNYQERNCLRSIKRRDLGISDDDFVFGFVGRLSKDKGSNELLTAYKKIRTAHKNLRLMLIGTVEPQNGFDLELYRWARDTEDVMFIGSVNNNDLKNYYSALDCYVHPSYREGFGMVIQEAAAMGCPVITTDINGASEVLVSGESCILCKPADAESLAGAMEAMIQDDSKRRYLAENALERVKKLYNRKDMQERLLKDYRRLLNEESDETNACNR